MVKLPNSNSFFLLGARGTGKSTLIKQWFGEKSNMLFIDLLKPATEDLYRLDPEELTRQVIGKKLKWVVIDEYKNLPTITLKNGRFLTCRQKMMSKLILSLIDLINL